REGSGAIGAGRDLRSVIDRRVNGVIGRRRNIVRGLVESPAIAIAAVSAVTQIRPVGARGRRNSQAQEQRGDETKAANHGVTLLGKRRRRKTKTAPFHPS